MLNRNNLKRKTKIETLVQHLSIDQNSEILYTLNERLKQYHFAYDRLELNAGKEAILERCYG